MMNRIKELSTGPAAEEREVLAALRKYSVDYLLPEIRDELCGLLPQEDAERALQLLGMMGRRQFAYEEIVRVQSRDERFKQLPLMKILEQLFDCSAIGNVRAAERDEAFRFTFKYRNRDAVFNPNDQILVHRGIQKALNLA